MIILYIDDDLEDIEIFNDAIKQIDPTINCLTTTSGIHALELLKTMPETPNYIFLDINMPLMNGKECLREIKKIDSLKATPVIMYSTSTNTNEIKECYSLGATDFLIKPDQLSKLCEDLDSIFSSSKGNSSYQRHFWS